MPLLGHLLGSLFGALAGMLLHVFGLRVAVRVAAVAAVAAFGVILLALFNGIVAPMAAGLFSTAYGQLLGLAFPPIAGTVVTGLVALWAGCAVYKLKVQAVKISATV